MLMGYSSNLSKPRWIEQAKAEAWAEAKRRTQTIPRGIDYRFRGSAERLQSCKAQEVMISGPAETGKTIACLTRLHNIACRFPGAQLVIVRKTYQSTVSSVVQSFIKKIMPKSGVTPYGGERPSWFDYANGSRIWIGGMDNPDKVLSSERDIVYVNQSEELSLSDWEYLTTRATGRAGNVPYGQVMGDCNPGAQTHWILGRAQEGKLLMLESRHQDNPALYDEQGNLTVQGVKSMTVLDALTGVRKERLRFGRWASAEGAVYEFDRAVHIKEHFTIPADWKRFRAIDFGYTNPFVCQWWAVDGDGRMYLYREIYKSKTLVEDHAQRIKTLSDGERITVSVADHDAEDRATLARHGVPTIPAVKDVSTGIQAVQARLSKAGDGKPRLYFVSGALVDYDESLTEGKRPTSTEQEIEGYAWPKGSDGKPVKESPVKVNDHGMDAMRYAVMYQNMTERLVGSWG